MIAEAKFKQGDRVKWSAGQGQAQGVVQEVVFEPKTVAGQTVGASEDDPRYIVENDSTGNLTGHRAAALTKLTEADNAFQPGDSVKWNSAQGEVDGKIKEKLTSPTKIKGHTAEASEGEPQYLVESKQTGSKAAHKPSALKPI